MTRHRIENICWKEFVWRRSFKLEQVHEMLAHLATVSSRGAVIWEIRARDGFVRHLLGADSASIRKITEALQVHGDKEFYPVTEQNRKAVNTVRQIKVSHPSLSLRTDITESTIRAGLAAMAATARGEEAVLQITLGAAYPPSTVPKNLPDPNAGWLQAVLGNVSQASTETRKSIKEKAEQHSFQATIRIGVSGTNARYRITFTLSALRTLEAAGGRIYDEPEKPTKINSTHVPWHFPLKLSVKELAGFLMLPSGDEELPGMSDIHPRAMYPPTWYREPTNRFNSRSFGTTLNPANSQKLSISPEDSLEHTILLGPTGSGKSTAMLNLILSDINAGRSVLVIDPKADLVTSILERIPVSRADDVVVIDPSDDNPVGFNPLALPGNPTLIADAILAVIKEIFSDSWGVRSQDVLSAALLTLVDTDGASLLWLPPLLTDENFRHKITKDVKDKITLKPFWDTFDNLRPAEREQWVAPVLNKMRQFLFRPGLRGILGQSNPKFQLTDLFSQRKIVLVPLNRGTVGAESARLLGSLVVGLTWTLALSRANVAPERRHLVSLYIDELQDYLTLPTDLSDALAQARGLGVGITMAHQYRAQLPYEIRAGIDANARNKIIFGLNASDAREIATMAPGLEALDFMLLPRYQIYTNFMSSGRQTGWIQGKTIPAPPSLHTAAEIKAKSQTRYGRSSGEVEAEYLKLFEEAPSLIGPDLDDSAIGRRKL